MRIRRLILVGTIALSLGLGGCAQAPDLPDDVATALQSHVMDVSTAAADLDYATALTRLAELDVSLDDAIARGTITAERAQAIRSAIELVRADLTALSVPPEPVDEGNDGPGNGNGNGNGKDKDKDD
ncbi:MAG: hypothetical protein JWP85_900 [Rhodoglobus sp.]|nr:hypothetical protein [Rhodoglobus sp.]